MRNKRIKFSVLVGAYILVGKADNIQISRNK